MSERGVYAVDRGIWDHPFFADEPLTEREAWQWLIAEASFRARHRRLGDQVFDLDVGQLVVSIRFLAERWKWSKGKVERFLDRLKEGKSSRGGRPKKNLEKPPSKSETMIETRTETGFTIITICNYKKYQKVSLPSGTASGAASGTPAGHLRDKEESTESTESKDGGGEERVGKLVTPEALQLTEKLLVIARHDPKFWPPGWCGAPMRVQMWLTEGWLPDLIVAGARSAMAKTRDPPYSVQFFENAIAREIARQSAPLPTVEVKPAEILTVYHENSRVRPNSSLTDSIRRELAELERSESADLEVSARPVLRISN